MNRYIPVFVVMGIISLVGYMGYSRFETKYRNELVALAQTAEKENRTEFDKFQAQQAGLVGDLKTAEVVDRFLQEWSLHVNESNSGQYSIVSTMTRLATENSLIMSRQPVAVNPQYPLVGEMAPVLNVGFSVTGYFPQVIRWLGQVEEAYLFSRIEKLSITPASSESNEVTLNCTIAFLQETNP